MFLHRAMGEGCQRRGDSIRRLGLVCAAALLGLISWVAPARAQGGAPCNDCGPLDVVFIVDDTGSMGPAIAGIQAGIANIIEQIKCASDDDYQLGLITFKDCVIVNVPLASGNDAGIAAAVAGLTAFGGGNTPEASDAAVNAAVNSLPAASNCCQFIDFSNTWRPTATKIVILITDAVPGGCDDMFTPGVDDVNANQYALDALGNGILISAINVLGFPDPTLAAIMQNYATVTGGTYVDAPNGVGIEAAITTILEACGGAGGEPPCATVDDISVLCDPADDGIVTITLTITNNSGIDAGYLLFTPQSPDPTEVLFIPNIMPVNIPNGTSSTVTVTVVDLGGLGSLSGQEICFTVTLKQSFVDLCADCCSVQVCITPDCECLQIPEQSIDCLPGEPGSYTWTFSMDNLSGQVVHHAYFFTPPGVVFDTPGAANNYIYFSPPISPGASTGPIKVVINFPSGTVPPPKLCFWISLHDVFLNVCCKKKVCITLPDCDDPTGIGACCFPDGTCAVTTSEECEIMLGIFFGDGTSCDDPAIHCGVPSLGGCCLPSGICVDVSVDECLAIGGLYLGDGVVCGTPGVICPIDFVGACCIGDGCLNAVTIDQCNIFGGYFLGFGSMCDPAANVCRGACCLPTGGCFQTPFFAECEGNGGVFLGPGSTCADCPPPTPLLGDFNGDGVVDADDLGILLGNFGATIGGGV